MPGSLLLAKLRDRTPFTYLALGDSITHGMGVRDPQSNCWPALLQRALSEQFGHPALQLVNAGSPGAQVGQVLGDLDRRLSAARPDLVTVQYGGNDSRLGTDPRTFRAQLGELVDRVNLKAICTVLCVPPLEDKFSDTAVSEAIHTAARKRGLVVADLEAAMKPELREFRGPFPWGEHPDEHAHVAMAQEVYQALARSMALPGDLSLRLVRGTRFLPAASESVDVVAQVSGPRQVEVKLELDCGGQVFSEPVSIPSIGQLAKVVAVPRKPGPMAWTGTVRAWCSVRQDRGADALPGYGFDVAWLSVAPVLPVGEGFALSLTRDYARTGADQIISDADLSALVTTRMTDADLVINVDVTDDVLCVDNAGSAYESDCVELYLDARPPEQQGAGFYSRGVFLVLVVPAAGTSRVTWVTSKPLPSGWRESIVETHWRPGGYVVESRIPKAACRTAAGKALDGIGFDVAVDDSDNRLYRQSQLVWSGSTRNYLVPSEFGGLDLRDRPDAPGIRVTVH